MFEIFNAVRKGNVSEIKKILQENPEAVFLQDEEGNTPLHVSEKLSVTKLLVEYGAPLNIYNYYGNLPVDIAGNAEIKNYLEKQNPHSPKTTELQDEISRGNKQAALLKIESNSELEVPDFYGKTPLHMAVLIGDLDIVKALVSKGVSLDNRDRMGFPPIYYAGRFPEIKKHLENNGALPFDISMMESDFTFTELHEAASSGKIHEIRKIISEKTVCIDALDRAEQTPLFHAVLQRQLEAVEVLIANGASLDGIDGYGSSPIHYAARYNNIGILKALVENGADVNAFDLFSNCTPLHIVVQNSIDKGDKTIEIVDYLLKQGANPEDLNHDQCNIVESAKVEHDGKMTHTSLSKFLKNHIGLHKEYLKNVRESFGNILSNEIKKAYQAGKKLILLLGELHGDFKIYQIEKIIVSIAQKFGINNLYSESDGFFPVEIFAQKNGMTFQCIDTHPDRDIVEIDERNVYMARNINRTPQDAIVITGLDHLQGLLMDDNAKINTEKFHVLPFNLSGVASHQEMEDEIANNPSRVIQLKIQKECFSSPDLLDRKRKHKQVKESACSHESKRRKKSACRS